MGIQNRKAMGKNLRNVDMERAQLLNYCTTLVGLTLIILFVEMLKISTNFLFKEQNCKWFKFTRLEKQFGN
jgi:hypothetical protein